MLTLSLSLTTVFLYCLITTLSPPYSMSIECINLEDSKMCGLVTWKLEQRPKLQIQVKAWLMNTKTE